MYDLMLNVAKIFEYNKGFKAKRVCKATKKGTSITFELIETIEEAKQIRSELEKQSEELINKLKERLKEG